MNKGIQKIFSEVSHSYELVNHVLTFGLDILWRRKAAKTAAMGGGERWMDICTGTGEMAANLGRLAGKKTMVVAADASASMVHKATAKPEAHHIVFVIADASALPFCDETLDLITISFATRNLNTSRDYLLQCFREFHRILKPRGRFVNLETTQPTSGSVRRLFRLYVRLAVKPVGSIISGSTAGYAYLSHTIPLFHNAEELADIIRQAGFASVDFHRMPFGIAAIHEAVKCVSKEKAGQLPCLDVDGSLTSS